ncbi:MAG: hypothetical protein DBX59_08515 [Bacillota bacterium]|nr:MAG: hypothetical protein DBX59_08515 [Bacillota bacterium]
MKQAVLKHKNALFSLLAVLAMAIFALSSETYAAATLDGIKLWAFNIVPSVFPYFVLTALLTSLGSAARLASKCSALTKRLFGCGGMSGYAFFIAAVSGYPAGSKITAELYLKRLVSREDAYKMSGFCAAASPLFILGTTGAMLLKNRAAGLAILCAHLFSVLFTAFLLRGKRKTVDDAPPSPPAAGNADNMLYEAVYDSVISLLVLGGIVTVYFVLIRMLENCGAFYLPVRLFTLIFGEETLARGFVYGLVECTAGVSCAANSLSTLKIPAVGFLISFGGLSVMTQSLIFLKKAKIKTARFFLSKLLHAAFTFIILFFLTLLMPL